MKTPRAWETKRHVVKKYIVHLNNKFHCRSVINVNKGSCPTSRFEENGESPWTMWIFLDILWSVQKKTPGFCTSDGGSFTQTQGEIYHYEFLQVFLENSTISKPRCVCIRLRILFQNVLRRSDNYRINTFGANTPKLNHMISCAVNYIFVLSIKLSHVLLRKRKINV